MAQQFAIPTASVLPASRAIERVPANSLIVPASLVEADKQKLSELRPRLLGGAQSLPVPSNGLDIKYAAFPPGTHIVMIGCGSIGQGTLPLLFRHFEVQPQQVIIITGDDRGKEVAKKYGVQFKVEPLKYDNYKSILAPYLTKGSFMLNLSVDVSSIALMELCNANGVLYLDTCTEPWLGEYSNPELSDSERSNYALRQAALVLKKKLQGGPTAVITHGANPGLVSHFVKQALLNIAKETDFKLAKTPSTREEWAKLARDLGIKVIHIAERDTQLANPQAAKKPHEFVNTWSCDGFISEGCYQPCELGWGTHEKEFPADGAKHDTKVTRGSEAPSIYLKKPGGTVKVRTWTPGYGPFQGLIVTHAESISIADYFTVKEDGKTAYRPTVHYAYHPCDYAMMSIHEMVGSGFVEQKEKRVLRGDEIISGMDELGVLLMGHKRGAYWYGSQLTNDEACKIAPHQNATGMQVTGPIIGAMVWALEHPSAGVVEPDEMDFKRVLDVAKPYLGKVVGHYSDWTPLKTRGPICTDPMDAQDPWQFKNFRVL